MTARITAAEVIAAVRRVAVDSCGWWDWAAETCGCLGSTIAADHTSAALRAEVEKHLGRITEERDEARAEAERLRAKLAGAHETMMHQLRAQAAECERDLAEEREEAERLRAIVEGRTTPPTREECDAIVAEGGWWRCAEDGSLGMAMCVDWDDVALVLRDAATEGVTLRWWSHDRTGRPCAWPTVGGAR